MMIKIFSSFALVLLFNITMAQEGLPFYDHYLLSDYYLINPSFAGQDEKIMKLDATYYSQWAGVEDAPTTQTLSFHTRVDNRLALGTYIYHDTNGASKLAGLNFSGAYHIPIGDGENFTYDKINQFSFGLSYHVFNQSFDRSKWNILHQNDPLLVDTSYFTHYFNIGTSFFYDGFYGGVSMVDMPIGDNRHIVNALEPLPTWYYFMAGYQYHLTETIRLEPVILYNLNSNSERQIDVAFRSRFAIDNNAIKLGVNYRTDIDNSGTQGLSLTPLINLEIGSLNVGYAYRMGLTDISQKAGSTHLISLGYNFINPFEFR